MHRHVMTVAIQTEGGWVATARHMTEMRKQRIAQSIPAALPTLSHMRILLQASRTCSLSSFGFEAYP